MKPILIATLMSLATLAHGAGDPAAGQAKSGVCAGCHGVDGNSANPVWPKLAGQHDSYIVKQLQDFKASRRQDPTMAPMAATLADEQANGNRGSTDPPELFIQEGTFFKEARCNAGKHPRRTERFCKAACCIM